MNCCICLDKIEQFFDAKISKCKHYFCEQCVGNLVMRNCLLCNNSLIASIDEFNKYSHYERFINSDNYSIRMYNVNINDQNYSYPSVTSVTGMIGFVGFRNFQNKVVKESSQHEYDNNSKIRLDRGTLVHLVIEKYLKSRKKYNVYAHGKVAGDIVQSMMHFLNKITNIKLQEYVLISSRVKIAGQVDCIAYYDGKLSVIDFKTSDKRKTKSNTKAYFQQCAAYAECFEETFAMKIEQLILIIGIANENASQIMIEPFTKITSDSLQKLRDDFFDTFEI